MHLLKLLTAGDSFTWGEELTDLKSAWPFLLGLDAVNLAQPGASNDYIVQSIVEYIVKNPRPNFVIVAWTTPNRIDISGKHLTPTSQGKYGDALIDNVFKDWDELWARSKFLTQVELLHAFLDTYDIPHVFVSTFDIQTWAIGNINAPWLGWPNEGIVEWMGDCPKGPGGHPLELGHQRIAEKINEHIRHLGWVS